MVEVRRSLEDVRDSGAEQLHKVAGGGCALRDPRPALLRLKVQPDQALLDLTRADPVAAASSATAGNASAATVTALFDAPAEPTRSTAPGI